MTDEQIFAALKSVDPDAVRLPTGFRLFALAILQASRATPADQEPVTWPVPLSMDHSYHIAHSVELRFESEEDADEFFRLYSAHMGSATPADHMPDAGEKVDAGSVPVAWQYENQHGNPFLTHKDPSTWHPHDRAGFKNFVALHAAPPSPQVSDNVRDAVIDSIWVAEVCQDADGFNHIEAVVDDLDDIRAGTRLYAAAPSAAQDVKRVHALDCQYITDGDPWAPCTCGIGSPTSPPSDAKDAERYRWLREHCEEVQHWGGDVWFPYDGKLAKRLDKAIDDAIHALKSAPPQKPVSE